MHNKHYDGAMNLLHAPGTRAAPAGAAAAAAAAGQARHGEEREKARIRKPNDFKQAVLGHRPAAARGAVRQEVC